MHMKAVENLHFEFVAPRKCKVLVNGRSSKQARAAYATQGTRAQQPATGSRRACFASLTTAMQPASSGEGAAGERFHGSSSSIVRKEKEIQQRERAGQLLPTQTCCIPATQSIQTMAAQHSSPGTPTSLFTAATPQASTPGPCHFSSLRQQQRPSPAQQPAAACPSGGGWRPTWQQEQQQGALWRQVRTHSWSQRAVRTVVGLSQRGRPPGLY